MKLPENSTLRITSVKIGYIEKLSGKINGQSGIEFNYKIIANTGDFEKGFKDVVVHAGTFCIPIYSDVIEFNEKEKLINSVLKDKVMDIIVAGQEYLMNHLKIDFELPELEGISMVDIINKNTHGDNVGEE